VGRVPPRSTKKFMGEMNQYEIILQAMPDHPAPPARRLAGALKVLWRRFGLKCVGYRRIDPVTQPAAPVAKPKNCEVSNEYCNSSKCN
jgi:hypothetical protein